MTLSTSLYKQLSGMSMRMFHLQNETNASCPDLRGQNYRASFHTHSSARGTRKKIYHGHLDGKGPRKGEHAVVKVFRDAAGTEAMCDSEMEKHKLARKLAKRFNKLVPDDHYRISFTLPLKSTVERLGVGCYLTRHKTRHMDKKEWVLIEENLTRQGEYQSFVRKTGERLSNDPTTLDAFLHFTYHESQGHFVLCGFQGVQTDAGYLLTTPCIHSADQTFGPSTDKGPRAIRKVFDSHRCNNLCYSFIRPEKCDDDDDETDSNDSDTSEEKIKVNGVVEKNDLKTKENGVEENNDLDYIVPENGVLHHALKLEKIEEKEEPVAVETKRRSLKRKDSKKKKDRQDHSTHRSNVKALLGIKKRPSF